MSYEIIKELTQNYEKDLKKRQDKSLKKYYKTYLSWKADFRRKDPIRIGIHEFQNQTLEDEAFFSALKNEMAKRFFENK